MLTDKEIWDNATHPDAGWEYCIQDVNGKHILWLRMFDDDDNLQSVLKAEVLEERQV